MGLGEAGQSRGDQSPSGRLGVRLTRAVWAGLAAQGRHPGRYRLAVCLGQRCRACAGRRPPGRGTAVAYAPPRAPSTCPAGPTSSLREARSEASLPRLGWVDRPPAPQVQSPLTPAKRPATGPVGGACGLTRDIITGQRAGAQAWNTSSPEPRWQLGQPS